MKDLITCLYFDLRIIKIYVVDPPLIVSNEYCIVGNTNPVAPMLHVETLSISAWLNIIKSYKSFVAVFIFHGSDELTPIEGL